MKEAAHPRLFFDAGELAGLRAQREAGPRSLIWANLRADAEARAARPPTTDWIAPREPDPVYENLYDRFWAMLGDSAVVEQLAFAAAIGDEPDLRDAAVRHLLAAGSRWAREADLAPDYGTAYATTRVVKAIAVGYDLLADALTEAERIRVRDLLAGAGERLADEWFARPEVAGPVGLAADRHSPHHSAVEWSAFGLAALALHGEVPAADRWVAMVERQLRDHLLGSALDRDGAQPEGTAFWSSTVFSLLQVTDALRRQIGVDLLGPFARSVDPRLAYAAFRPDRERTPDGAPWYGESTAMSAVLFALAAERGDPHLQRLALDESTTGRLEVWPARTPHRGEQLSFAPGGYAYVWCRPDLEPAPLPTPTPWRFPSVGETYLRTGWGRTDLQVVIRHGRVSVHAGEHLLFEDLTPVRRTDVEASRAAGTGVDVYDPPGLAAEVDEVGTSGSRQWAHARGPDGRRILTVELDAARRMVVISRSDAARRTWATGGRTELTLLRGRVHATTTDGHQPDRRAGYGLLDVVDTDPRRHPTMTVDPDGDAVQLCLSVGPSLDEPAD